jgi:hypothetical protein
MRPLAFRRFSSLAPALALGALLVPVAGCGTNLPGTASSYVIIQSPGGSAPRLPPTCRRSSTLRLADSR